MEKIPCINCEKPVDAAGLLVTYDKKFVTGVCTQCLASVRKPRVTLTRDSPETAFRPLQYSSIETFKQE